MRIRWAARTSAIVGGFSVSAAFAYLAVWLRRLGEFVSVSVCVPVRGFGEVRISTPDHSTVPGDLQSGPASVIPRQGGIDIADIAEADEIGGSCHL